MEVKNMKHEPKATAHAIALVGGAWYVLCVLWVAVSQGSYMGIMSSWFHGVDFAALPPATPDMGSITVGLLTFVGFAWISGYAFTVAYNYFLKK